jgi:hypothetical protein
MPTFEKWWDDLKKHRKRLENWLPHWRNIANEIGDKRSIRYFTLCANSMIDVFMLIREGVLEFDATNYSIGSVRFCEYEVEQFNEITEMMSREGSGFLGRLEEMLLFRNDDYTAQFPTPESIDLEFAMQGESIPEVNAEMLRRKRRHFEVRATFPYDCINLDFCQYYYPNPPGMLRINETIERILEWQLMPSADGEEIEIEQFLLSVTCRHDANFPQEAERRLRELIRENCATSQVYQQQVNELLGAARIEEWPQRDAEGFFFSGWPKDIARSARECGWGTEILDYVYYRRVGDEGNPYVIVCLVIKFFRVKQRPDYMPVALLALRPESRKLIAEVDRASNEGRQLLADLREVVAIRNQQAVRKHCPVLPLP